MRAYAQDEALMQALPFLEDDPALAANDKRRGLKGKSGTMDYAHGLAGFFRASDGRLLAFAIFVFDRAWRAVLDATMDQRILESASAPRAWTRRAVQLDDALLQDWMAKY
jgi:serine-type D-Ala-D-Ala carboxypeptidase/endopeptidase (penicillin-binding protein 4)